MTKPIPDPDDDALAAALHASRTLVDAPESVIQRAIGLFEASPRRAARPLLPRLLAALQFDSGGLSPLAHGMRSTGGEVRQLLYTLDDCDIDLRVAPADGTEGRYSLTGQLLGPETQGVVVAEFGADAGAGPEPARAALNDLGEFRLPPLPAGAWRLTLELADRSIELPVLELAADRGARM